VRSDGLVLVRVPASVGAGPITLQRNPGGLLAAIKSNPLTGAFSQYASVDGIERIYTYGGVGEYPLYVSMDCHTAPYGRIGDATCSRTRRYA
jgi:hypothetical protein